MGTGHSVQSYIELQTPSFRPGEGVSGVVNLNVQAATSAGALSINLVGKEFARWVRQRSYGKTSVAEFLRGTHKVIDVSYPIWDFGGSLPEGQYSIPFRIQTPNWLPPSFLHKGTLRKAKIYYRLRAVVDDKKKTKTHKNTIWASKFPLTNIILSNVSEETRFDVRNCCCFKAGNTNMTAYITRNFAMPTDTLAAYAKPDNSQGKKTIKSIHFMLVRHVLMQIKTGIYKGSTKLDEDSYLENTESINIPSGEILNQNKEIVVSFNLSEIPELWGHPTVSGELIECYYTVDVSLLFNNFCGCRKYVISLPLDICNGIVTSTSFIIPAPQLNFEWSPTSLSDVPVQASLDVPIPEEYLHEIEMSHNEKV